MAPGSGGWRRSSWRADTLAVVHLLRPPYQAEAAGERTRGLGDSLALTEVALFDR